MTVITRDLARILGEELDTAAAIIAARHGLTAKRGGSTGYDATSAKVSIQFVAVTEGGLIAGDVERYKAHAELIGLPVDGIGREFRSGARTFRIVGMRNTRSDKCVNLIEPATGKTFHASPDMIAAHLTRAKAMA